MEIISLSTGTASTDKIKTNLLDAHAIGETTMNKFIHEREVNTTTQFSEPLRKLKVGTFSSMKKAIKVQTNSKDLQFSAQSNIFGRIALIQNIYLIGVFCYPLGSMAWSNRNVTGVMPKTNKLTSMHKLERGVALVDTILKPFVSVINGMALAH